MMFEDKLTPEQRNAQFAANLVLLAEDNFKQARSNARFALINAAVACINALVVIGTVVWFIFGRPHGH